MARMKAVLILCLLVALLAACGTEKKGNSVKQADLGTISNGVVLYYDDSDASAKLLNALTELAKTESFELAPVHAVKDNAKIEAYEQSHQTIIKAYNEVRALEARMGNLKSGTNSADAAAVKNGISVNYRKALNLVKSGQLADTQKKELDQLVKAIAEKQELNEAEIMKLLNLQTAARLQIPVYSRIDGDSASEKLPMMKVIYEGNVRTTFAFGQKPVPAETLDNAEQLKYYLKEKAWISNFQESSDGDTIKKKLDKKESFILLAYGNSCPHCHKVMPVLDKLTDQTGVKIERIDTFIESNNKAFAKLVASKKYNLTDIKWVPTLIYIKDGKQTATIGASDWMIENASADLGYDINDAVIKKFIEQAK